jgi:hypothetical protein
MKEHETMPFENMELLKEITQLKTKKSVLYTQSGPNSSDYLDLTIKLNVLVTQYIDEKIDHLMNS